MTPQEHQLMVFMLIQQNLRFRALLEILKSRSVLDESDFDAFEHLTVEMHGTQTEFATIDQYTEFAKLLGLQHELPGNEATPRPKSSKDSDLSR